MPKPAQATPTAAPELGAELGIAPPATPTPASDGATKADGIDPQEFRQMMENQKVMFAALKALGNQQYEVVPDNPAPQPEAFEFPEIEGFEALRPVMNQVFGTLQTKVTSQDAEIKRLQAKLEATRLQDHWGFFRNGVKDWEQYNAPMGAIVEDLGVKPQNADQFRRIYELAKAEQENARLRAELAAAQKAGPVPVLRSATPSLREKMSKQFPNRGAQFGAVGFIENLAKVRLNGGGS